VSATVAPKLTIFGGSFLNLNFGGGGGRRGRGKGGLLKRLSGFVLRGYREVTGGSKPGTSRPGGGRTGGGDSAGFDRFRDSRPDLFEGQLGDDDEDLGGDAQQVDAPTSGDDAPDPGWQGGCPNCGHPPGPVGARHYEGCSHGWGMWA
jgi:hypothetical protein